MRGWNYIRENLETRLPIIKQQNPNVPEPAIRAINKQADPTGDKASFTPWLVRMYSKGFLKAGQFGYTKNILNKYSRLVSRGIIQGKDRDINTFKTEQELYHSIKNAAKNYINTHFSNNKYIKIVQPDIALDLSFADPTGTTGKYISFIIKNFIEGRITEANMEEDLPKIKEALKFYDHMEQNGQFYEGQIKNWDLHDLFFYVQEKRGSKPLDAELVKYLSQYKITELDKGDNVYSIYKLERKQINLLTAVSANTSWCVKREATAKYYFGLDESNFFLVITKNDFPTYLVHYPSLQIRNSLDERVQDKELARELLSKVYPSDIMQPWNELFEVSAANNRLMSIMFFRMSYDETLKHIIKDFKELGTDKLRATNLIIVNFKNNFPVYASLWNTFTDIQTNEEKVKFKDQCKLFVNSLSDSELRSLIYFKIRSS